MKLPRLEIADLFLMFGDQLRGLLPEHYKVMNAIKNCRTKVLGGHLLQCNSCSYQKKVYNSCRNRHCPKCMFLTKLKWIDKRKQDILPCSYFHVVFTLPYELRKIILLNKEVCYNLLFKASSEALKKVTRDSKTLNGEIGFIGVLHTWSQSLIDHPHIHYIVPGGVLRQQKWITSSEKYLLPVEALSEVFMGIFLKSLRKLFDDGELNLTGDIEYLSHYANFQELLTTCSQVDWVVYCKRPFAGPEQVINYLGSYTHRIAISNYRLVGLEGDEVIFKIRDKNSPGKSKTMRLKGREFLRRFLLHVLPKGFMRIRHFGLLGNRLKKEKIEIIRKLENIAVELINNSDLVWQELLKIAIGIDINLCPSCKTGELITVGEIKEMLNSA